MDGTCSTSDDLGLLASGYGSGLVEFAQKGKVTIDELAEDAPTATTTQATGESSMLGRQPQPQAQTQAELRELRDLPRLTGPC